MSIKWSLLAVVPWMDWSQESREAVLSPGPAVARLKRGKRVQGRQKLWVGCGSEEEGRLAWDPRASGCGEFRLGDEPEVVVGRPDGFQVETWILLLQGSSRLPGGFDS